MMADSNRFIVQVFVGALSQHYEALSVEASKQTTSEEIVSCIVERLCLTNAVEYELAEVVGQECKERRLGPQECPVALMLLWPRKSFDSNKKLLSSEPSTYEDQHRFYLREKLSDAHWTDSFTMDPQLIRDYFYLFLYQPKDRDYPDLCQLPDLNEQTLLENLRARFSNGHIYTYVGSILIAVNPFKFYPIYNPKYVKLYQNRRLGDMPPHIFAIADAAYHSMLREKCNQCIVISGESGSGKTESTNFLLHHLTALSQKGSHGSGVEQTILSAGPVLEAFGNAKTAHNNNSSRFGKFIQVNYKENGMVHGAVVQKYLLEKSRICSQGRTERNYHVFYYLLAGASDIEKKALHLKRAEDYNYLSRCASNDVDESYEFSRLKQSMEMVGFSAEKQRRLFAVLSAVLLLGNVEFAPRKSAYHHDEAVGVRNPEVVSLISELLRVKEETLMAALTAKRARASGETLVINYRLPEAIAARDAMAKCLYGALFDWIVLQVNHALLSKKDTLREHQGHSIGVLDIFGFEDFGVFNSFEQFCINYANEHLQFYFNQHVFKYEQEEYRKEGIKWKSIDFMDNTGCLHLIEGKPNGLLCILDDQCNFPGATNETLLQKFNSVHKENNFYEVPQKREAAFIVRHYAGKVKYQVLEVREKNLDLMRQDIVSVLKNSSMAFVRELVGADPVAVFRWAIVRAFFRAYFAFNEAGTRHRLVRVDGSKASLMHHRYRSHPPNESIIRHSTPTSRRGGYSKKENERRESNARKKSLGEEQELSPVRKESVAGLERVLCPSEARVLERANQIVMYVPPTKSERDPACRTVMEERQQPAWFAHCMGQGGGDSSSFHTISSSTNYLFNVTKKNKSFRPRERGKKGLKNLETVKTLAGRTQSYGNSQMKGVGTRKQPLTVTAQFQQSLHSLMVTLNQANPFFIRCIKSNSNKVPNEFDADTVQRQLRYTGMLETVRIRQAGYNVRLTYDEFIQLYRILLPKGLVSSQSDVRDFLLTLNLNRDNYQIGHTKVFLRESEKVKLDYRLHQQIIASIVAIQRWFRACLDRKRFLQLRSIATSLQSHCRAYLVRQRVNHMRLTNSAALYIQKSWRGYQVRSWYRKLLGGVQVVQAHVRGTLARRRFHTLMAQHQAQRHRGVTKVANKSIIHLNADDSYLLRDTSQECAQRKRDSQNFEDMSRQLKNLPPLETEIPKRRLIPKKVKATKVESSPHKHTSFEEVPPEQAGAGASIFAAMRKGSSESLTSLKSTDSTASASKPTLQHRAKKQIQALIGGRIVEKWGNNSAAHSDSEADDNSSKNKDSWKKETVAVEPKPVEPPSPNKPLARSAHVMLHRYSSGESAKPDRGVGFVRSRLEESTKPSDNPWPGEPEVVRPSRHHRAGREMSYSVGDHDIDQRETSPALRWSRTSESPESNYRSRVDTRGSEGSSESSLMSPRDPDWQQPVFLKVGSSAAAAAASSAGSQKRQWSPQRREQLDLKRRNSDPAKSMAATAMTHPDPLNTPDLPKSSLDMDIEYKGTMFTIAGHRFRKVTRFSKEDKCVSCGKCMDAFITQGHKCTECKQLFHTKCIQNGGVLQMPCQHASGGGKPGRRKHRKHSRTPYDMNKPGPVGGKFSLTGTSEFTDSTDKIISDARELQLMQDFITNKIYKIESEEGKKPSVVDRVFKQALKEFKDNLLSTYSIVNKQGVEALNIKYKDLIANFLQVMETVCYQENTKEDFPVTMGVNAFRGFMNEFMAQNRLEEKPKTKRKKEKKRKIEDVIQHFGHTFQLTIINIPTACEICTSFFMWPIERGLVCQNCKLTCHRKCYTKVKLQCGKEESKFDQSDGCYGQVFGAPLARLEVGECKVPVVVDRLITTIEMYGLYTEGLYRKSGVSSKVRELKARIEEDIDQVILENYQIHVLASLLKSFFRDMPEPLLTFECYEDFLRAGNLTDPQDRISTLFGILKKLPKANFALMERLIFHLARVALHEDANRMNSSALAIVFAPCILRTNKNVPAQDSLNDISRQTQCVETIVQEQLRKVRSTLADIETLDTACHTATNRLSSLRSSKVFQPEELMPASQQPSQSTSLGVSGSASAGEDDEEALLAHHIHAMQKEKALLTSTLPSLSHATSDDDLLSTDLDGSLDDVASATSHLDDSLPVTAACRVVPTPRSGGRNAKRTSSSSDHSVKSMCPPPDLDGEEDPIMV